MPEDLRNHPARDCTGGCCRERTGPSKCLVEKRPRKLTAQSVCGASATSFSRAGAARGPDPGETQQLFLDFGPPAACAWLATNATRFGFRQRYSWEPWHYGLSLAHK